MLIFFEVLPGCEINEAQTDILNRKFQKREMWTGLPFHIAYTFDDIEDILHWVKLLVKKGILDKHAPSKLWNEDFIDHRFIHQEEIRY